MPYLITTRTRIADLGRPRTISIREGFGGLGVAKGLRGFRVLIVLFNKYKHRFKPLLYQGATSALETSSIVVPFRKLISNSGFFFLPRVEVTQIKQDENYIKTSIGGVQYFYRKRATTNFLG